MNILHLSPYYPSIYAPHAGGACMGYEIEELSKFNDVYVLCFGSTTQDDAKLRKGLNAKKVECIKLSNAERILNVIKHPLTASMFATRKSKQFENKIKEIIAKYKIDAVHLEFAAMGQYIKSIKEINPNIQCNLILHDVTYQSFVRQESIEKKLPKKIFLKWQKGMVKKDEQSFLKLADNVLTFSPKDVDLIKQIYGVQAIWINTYFDVEDALKKGEKRQNNYQKSNNICFFGQMGRSENHLAAMKLLDIVQGINGIKTYIIGNKPSEELKAREGKNVVVTGFVEDPDEIMESCALAVFPLTVGAGIKIKVLHCMALGVPVITTQIGAEGIDDTGSIIDIVETDEEFRDHIQKRLTDETWLIETSYKEIAHIKENYLWDRTIKEFHKLYKNKKDN